MPEAGFRHKLVALDAWVRLPPLDFDCDIVEYPNSTQDEIPDRVRDATILVMSLTPLTRKSLEHAEKLQMINCNGVGTNQIDKEYVKERNITLCNSPAQNTEAVSQQAFALYFTLSRQVVAMQALTMEGKAWKEEVSLHKRFDRPPRLTFEETLIVIGYGALGKTVEKIGKSLGMTVLIAERKGAKEAREGRITFEEALTKGTLFILTTPLDDSTRGMFGAEEFKVMDNSALMVNVGRGGVIHEHEVITALRNGDIAGLATDVFEVEPATKDNTPLLDPTIPNLVVTPHLAWYSSHTIKGVINTMKANLGAFAAGRPQNVVIAGQGCPKE